MALSDLSPRVLAALASGALRSIVSAIKRGLSGLGLFNWIRKRFGPLTSGEGSQLYNLGNSYAQAGLQQSAIFPQAIINPANVPQATQYVASFGPNILVQYDVRIRFLDPATGREKWATSYVNSDIWLPYDQLQQEALASLQQRISDKDYERKLQTDIASVFQGLVVVGIIQR